MMACTRGAGVLYNGSIGEALLGVGNSLPLDTFNAGTEVQSPLRIRRRGNDTRCRDVDVPRFQVHPTILSHKYQPCLFQPWSLKDNIPVPIMSPNLPKMVIGPPGNIISDYEKACSYTTKNLSTSALRLASICLSARRGKKGKWVSILTLGLKNECFFHSRAIVTPVITCSPAVHAAATSVQYTQETWKLEPRCESSLSSQRITVAHPLMSMRDLL